MECAICLEPMRNPKVARCGHSFWYVHTQLLCQSTFKLFLTIFLSEVCIKQAISLYNECSRCRMPCTEDDLRTNYDCKACN